MNVDLLSVDGDVAGEWNVSLGDWDPSLETGMEAADWQHQAIFGQIRILLDRSRADRVKETLIFMAAYVVEHFGMEERLHQEADFPGVDEHLDAHNRYIAIFKELKQEYGASGNNIEILMKLVKFLLDWWKEHIRGWDQQFSEYFHRLQPPA